jgi:outer membrane protein assembly factor BamB
MIVVVGAVPAMADDWPTYRHDSSRSGLAESGPETPMPQRWVFEPQAPPTQAWAGPRDEPVEGNWEQHRVDYDAANHIVAVGDRVFLGSSGDSRVYCLDAETGRPVWSYMCGAPVRLAPSVHDGRVYFGSDDGHAYCVSAEDGSLIWRVAAGPDDAMCIGNERMISRWPIRTDVLIDGGVAYFGAGIFPHEGVYVSALDATTGEVIWRNDVLSQGSAGRNGFSPQGYILASATRLFIPSGRDLPAAFDRETGRQIFQSRDSWRSSGIVGGTYALLHGEHILVGANQAVAYSQDTGRGGFAWFPARRLVIGEEAAWMSTPTQVQSVTFEGYAEATRLTKAQERKRTAAKRKLSVVKKTLATYKKKPEDQQDADRLADLEEQVAEVQAEVEGTDTEIERLQAEGIEPSTAWSVDRVCTDALIVAGDLVFGGSDGVVVAFDAASGEEVWSAEVEGRARSLAVAGDALYVGTTDGLVYAFGQPLDGMAAAVPVDVVVAATTAPAFAAAADAIVSRSGVTRGYALVLGATDGSLACEIAARTEMKVYCLCPDDAALQRVRKTADARGMLGSRVWAERGDMAHMPYSSYFANLTVCESLIVDGTLPDVTPELVKRIKPCGGVVCIGRPANAPAAGVVASAAAWVKSLGLGDPQVDANGGHWTVLERGALSGAGDWTHQYADAANTTCGSDTIVKAPFRVLWYGDPGPDKMISRHARAAAPLVVNGRFFAQGYDNLMCYDAYNGLKYWERDIPGAKRGLNWAISRASNLCANQDAFFAAIGGRCLRLDPATGETVRIYDQPDAGDSPMFWNYVATVGDLLYGATGTTRALADDGSPAVFYGDQGRCSRLFALDLETGEPRWVHDADDEIYGITVSIGDGMIFFADSAVTDAEREEALAPRVAAMEELTGPDRKIAEERLAGAELVKAWCLDAETGEVIWSRPVDVTDCGGMSKLLITLYKDGVLVFCGAHYNGHYWHQFLGGEFGDRRVVALGATDGRTLWQKAIGYRIRPIIVGDMFVAEPWGFDLRTGDQRMRKHPLTGEETPWQFERSGHHCGCIAANNNTLFYRSWSLAYYDLIRDQGTAHSAGQRPGCWINFLPAAGLLIMPEASSGCQCLFSIVTTTVFEPYEGRREWGAFSSPGPHKPVREAHIDLGGPGDRRDDAGKLWLSYPRPSGRLKVPVDLQLTLAEDGGYFRNDADAVRIAGTGTPWVFGTGVAGLTGIDLPLLEAGSEPMVYTVRLHFADLADPQPGARVFDIKLQGRTVLEGLDIAAEARGEDRAVVKQFEGVKVRDALKIEFVPRTDATDPLTAPLLNAVELEGVPDPAMRAEVGNFEQPMQGRRVVV